MKKILFVDLNGLYSEYSVLQHLRNKYISSNNEEENDGIACLDTTNVLHLWNFIYRNKIDKVYFIAKDLVEIDNNNVYTIETTHDVIKLSLKDIFTGAISKSLEKNTLKPSSKIITQNTLIKDIITEKMECSHIFYIVNMNTLDFLTINFNNFTEDCEYRVFDSSLGILMIDDIDNITMEGNKENA